MIEISGYKFTNFTFRGLTLRVNSFSYFNFDINLDSCEENKQFLWIDLRNPIKLFINKEVKFNGYIKKIEHHKSSSNNLKVYCEDPFGPIGAPKINSLETQINMQKSGPDLIAFLADIGDFNYSKETIHGLNINKRPFLVTIPINNIVISSKVKLGKCIFHTGTNSPFIKKSESFNVTEVFGSIIISKRTYYEAITTGRRLIQSAVNILNFRQNIPTIFPEVDYTKVKSGFSINNIIYMNDIANKAQIIVKIPWENLVTSNTIQNDEKYLRPIQKLGNRIINQLIDRNRNLEIIILQYLNSAEMNPNKIESFLDLWIALDFTITRFGVKEKKQFSKHEIYEIKEYSALYYNTKKDVLLQELNKKAISTEEFEIKKTKYKEAEDRLLQLIEMFNQKSLIHNLENMMTIYELHLSKFEWETYRKARQKRNKIIHGNLESIPTQDELNILSKIIFFVLKKSLEDND